MKPNYITLIGPVLAALFALGSVLLYFYLKPEPAPAGVTIDARPAAEVKREVTVPLIVTAPIQVYKPAVKTKLKLPAAVIASTNTHIVASSKTANDERQHTITTTVDTTTGEFSSYDRVDPLPWLAINTKSQVGAFYGLKNGETAFRIQAQQELLQIKALHLGVTANADVTRGGVDTFVGVGAWARW